MQKFTEKIVSMMKAEKLFETQGGPIILSQVGSFSHYDPHLSCRNGLFFIFTFLLSFVHTDFI